MDLLFKNVTAVTMEPKDTVRSNTCVGIEGRKIVYMGDEANAPKAKRVIDGTYKVLIPGLYNCHTHIPMSLLRGFANGLALEEWLFEHIFPAEQKIKNFPEMIKTGALLSMAEMAASGTIAFSDMYFNMDIIAQAAGEAGMKANLSNAVIAFDPNTYDFYQDNCYTETLRVIQNFHNAYEGRIKAEASIHGVYTSHPQTWHTVLDFAQQNGLGMHVHLSETQTEQNNCLKTYGMTPAQIFDKHQVFSVPTTAAHCCWVTAEDRVILAERGVSVVHNPVSNLLLASGIAPVTSLLAQPVNVALGTDGMASNNSHDLFEEIKLASLLQKNTEKNPTVLPAFTALSMATVNGAKTQGREKESGKITIGYDADLVLLDFNSPRQSACYDTLSNLAYSTTGRDVLMTLCQGRVLYENGEYKTIDVEKVLYDVRKMTELFR